MSHQLLLPLWLLLAAVSQVPVSSAARPGVEPPPPPPPFDDSDGRKFFTLSLIVSESFRQLLLNAQQNVTNYTMHLANDVNCNLSPLNIQVVLADLEVWRRDEINVDMNSSRATRQLLRPHNWPQRTSHMTLLLGNWTGNKSAQGDLNDNSPRHLYRNTAALMVKDTDRVKVAVMVSDLIGRSLMLTPDKSDNCSCPTGICYLPGKKNLTSDKNASWTNCAVDQWKSLQQQLNGWLMSQPPSSSYTLQRGVAVCGNGIVEPWEQCDFAVGQNCRNPCCTTNCQLRQGARCAHGSCCDLTSCQPKNNRTVCRPRADDQCDIEERCDGVSTRCPSDGKVQDWQRCQYRGESARCFNGMCGSRLKWCRMLLGDRYSAGSDSCYDRNLGGSERGFCSAELNVTKSRPTYTYRRCEYKDKMCGSIFCKRGGSDCRKYDKDLRNAAWHLVPNGASCGNGGFCQNAACINGSEDLSTTSPSVRPGKGDLSTKSTSMSPGNGDLSTKSPSVRPGKGDLSTKSTSVRPGNGDLSTKSTSVSSSNEDLSTKSTSMSPSNEDLSTKSTSVSPSSGTLFEKDPTKTSSKMQQVSQLPLLPLLPLLLATLVDVAP